MIFTTELKFIQEKIITAAYPSIVLGEAKQSYICHTKNDVYLMAGIFGFDPGQVIERMGEYGNIGIQLYPSSLYLHGDIGITSGLYRSSPQNDIFYIYSTSLEDLVDYQKQAKEYWGLYNSPSSLSRVLNAMPNSYLCSDGDSIDYGKRLPVSEGQKLDILISMGWVLLKSDGSDATLFDQSSDTITLIAHELLSKEKF